MALHINTFGTLDIRLDGNEINEQFRTDKERALLLYLAVNAERIYHRDVLGEMLWPDRPPGSARTNLRQALYGVRRALEDQQAVPPYLLVNADTLQINPAAGLYLDVYKFSENIEAVRRHNHPDAQLCSQCKDSLEQALELYQGEFLEGLFLGESLAFHEWLLVQRERYQREYLLVLELLSLDAGHERDAFRAVELARRLVAANPLDESGHRLLMRSLVGSGRRNLALEHYQECRAVLLDELGVEPSQETRELYENIRAGSQIEHKKTGGLRKRTNLPGQLTAFVGRERELQWFEACLTKPECRLITIAGMSGIGKTRLALEVCHQQISHFKDGAWYIPVEGLQSTEQLVYCIGNVLGLHFDEFSPQRNQLLHFMTSLKILVLLDGFENLVAATGLLIDILQHAPEVKFMVTTRVRLNFQSVCILELQGLEFPRNGTYSEAIQQPAVQLFISRAQRIQPAFQLNEKTLADIVQICQLVEGHPLALELAASGLRGHTCRQIVNDIKTNLDSLQSMHLDIPVRHRSIRAALDQVWQGLVEEEKQALLRLSIFTGKFGLPAASEIASCDIQMLSTLVGKSLLLQDALNNFWLQPLVRTYLREILQNDPSLDETLRARHRFYYLHLVSQRTKELVKGKYMCQHLEELAQDIDHIRQAWDNAAEQQAWGDFLLAVEGMKHYFDISGNLPEGKRWFSKLVAALTVPLLTDNPPEEMRLLAGLAFETLGWFDFRMGRLAAAYESLLESVAILEGDLPDCCPELFVRGRTDALHQLGFAAAALGDYDRAREFFQQSLEFSREVENQRAQAYACLYLAEYATERQTLHESEQVFRKCLQIFIGTEDHRGAVRALIDLGDSAFQQGENEKALRLYKAAHEQVGALDSGWATAALYLKQAAVWRAKGNLDQAIHYTQKSLEIYQEVGDLRRISAALNLLGGLYLARLDFKQAVSLHEEALQLALDLGAAPLALACLVEIGYGYCLSGAGDKASQIFQQVLSHPAARQVERLTAARRLSGLTCFDENIHDEQLNDQAYLSSIALKNAVSRLLGGEALVPESAFNHDRRFQSDRDPEISAVY